MAHHETSIVHGLHQSGAIANVVKDLSTIGIALVEVENMHLVKEAFETTRSTLNCFESDPNLASLHSISSNATSAHATGYHKVGGMSSRYNAHREGFVFSDKCHTLSIDGHPDFEPNCRALHGLLHDIADMVLLEIQRSEPIFDDFCNVGEGPIRRRDNFSQWHIKRYHRPTQGANSNDNPSLLWLPTHMDPSLISIVIHDRPSSSPGGAGFQYFYQKQWHEIPVSGHNVAIVLVGSVLPVFDACRHRVRMTNNCCDEDNGRMAATLFVRPAPTEKLKNGLSFQHWLERTSKKYDASKNRQL